MSTVDTSFLAIERPDCPMHVGWTAILAPPAEGPQPTFEQFRDHVAGRLAHSPRYRQRTVELPARAWEPVWVDDPDFDFDRHIEHAAGSDLSEIVDHAMSSHLERGRPLWKMWFATDLPDGRVAFIGKAHHCMVDGLAALELTSLLFDMTPEPEATEPDPWDPRPLPGRRRLAAERLGEWAARCRAVVRAPVDLVRSGLGLRSAGAWVQRMASALADFVRPAPRSSFNVPGSPMRHQARVHRSLEELRSIKERFGTSLNDVLLAIVAGALRRHAHRRGEEPIRLKALVPVNVRDPSADADALGNQLSFMWIDLPCHEGDPVRRLEAITPTTRRRKEGRLAEGTGAIINGLAHGPRLFKKVVAHLFASPRTSNLIVSNLIGPPESIYMLGCELEELYPNVPLTKKHALAVGLMTVRGRACLSLYADAVSMPDADALAGDFEAAVDELLEASEQPADGREGLEAAEPSDEPLTTAA